jgi:hypothetical protein
VKPTASDWSPGLGIGFCVGAFKQKGSWPSLSEIRRRPVVEKIQGGDEGHFTRWQQEKIRRNAELVDLMAGATRGSGTRWLEDT